MFVAHVYCFKRDSYLKKEMESGQHRTTEANGVLRWSFKAEEEEASPSATEDVLISRLTAVGISNDSCPGRYLIYIQFISACGGGDLNPIPQYALLHRLHCHTTDPISAASVKEREKSELGHLVYPA